MYKPLKISRGYERPTLYADSAGFGRRNGRAARWEGTTGSSSTDLQEGQGQPRLNGVDPRRESGLGHGSGPEANGSEAKAAQGLALADQAAVVSPVSSEGYIYIYIYIYLYDLFPPPLLLFLNNTPSPCCFLPPHPPSYRYGVGEGCCSPRTITKGSRSHEASQTQELETSKPNAPMPEKPKSLTPLLGPL